MMTSMFESAVYARENHTPWARVDLIRFMKDMALGGNAGKVTLTVHYRHSVASRFWWTISWVDTDGERYGQSAIYLDKCLWRAAEAQIQLEERQKREKEIAR